MKNRMNTFSHITVTDMKNIPRKRALIIIMFVVIISVITGFIHHRFYYDCDWIVGKSYNEIVKRYGEFDYLGTKSDGAGGISYYDYFSLTDEIARRIFPFREPPWYICVEFDSNEMAATAYAGTPLGG